MEEEIDLKNILQSFWDRKIGMAIIILICVILGYIYTTYFVSPVYTATATAILTSSTGNETTGTQVSVTQSEVTLNKSLLSTYQGIATSDSVVEDVITNLGLNSTPDEVRKNIKVSSEEETQIINISVENADPSLAAKIANEIRRVFAERVAELYDMNNIKPLDDAKVPTAPSNINHVKDILMFAAGGIVLAIIYVVVANLLDNTVKSSSDIEKAIGINVIAEIPIYEYSKGRKR